MIPKYYIPPNQIASTEETRAGTADNKAVTPRGLHAALRYLGLIPEVTAALNSIYLRMDCLNTKPLSSSFGGHAILQFDNAALGDELQGGVYFPLIHSVGVTKVYLKILVGNTIGFIPVYLDSIMSEA